MIAPIALFVFSRVNHTRDTLISLKNNHLADRTDLIIFSDGPCDMEDEVKVMEVRKLIKSVVGFKSVKIVEREINYGLARNIIDGVTAVCAEYGRVIVMEDDIVVSPIFLTYMNQGLDYYSDDDRVISIHGYVYPMKTKLPETFFLRGADCWGWATWSRGWKSFNPDGKYLLKEIKRLKLNKLFNFNNSFNYMRGLAAQVKGKNDSWAVRWHASAFLNNKLTLYPGHSLAKNIGFDSSGRHSGTSNVFDTELNVSNVKIGDIKIEDSEIARKAFEAFFREHKLNPSQFRHIVSSLIPKRLKNILRKYLRG